MNDFKKENKQGNDEEGSMKVGERRKETKNIVANFGGQIKAGFRHLKRTAADES